jgi:hypothetical protein
MPLCDELVEKASKETETALIIIGRLAGESKDNRLEKGSYFLTEEEERILEAVTKYFKKTCVILNTGNVIDNNFVEKYGIDALLYVWQGGQEGTKAIVDVLQEDTPLQVSSQIPFLKMLTLVLPMKALATMIKFIIKTIFMLATDIMKPLQRTRFYILLVLVFHTQPLMLAFLHQMTKTP